MVSILGCNLDDDLGDRSCLNFAFVHHIFADHHFEYDLSSSDSLDNQNCSLGFGTVFSSHFALDNAGGSPCCYLHLCHHDTLDCMISNRRVCHHLLVVLSKTTSCCSLDLDHGTGRRMNVVRILTVDRILTADRKMIADRCSVVGLSCLKDILS